MNRAVRMPPRRQDGIAAVELAAMLLLLLFMAAFALFASRILLNYTALQKATYVGTRYLASVSTQDIRDPGRASIVMNMANNIMSVGTAELNSGQNAPSAYFRCDAGADCPSNALNPAAPTSVTIGTQLTVTDFVFSSTTSIVFPSSRQDLAITVTFPFTGN